MAVFLTNAVSASHEQSNDGKWFWLIRKHKTYLAHAAESRYKLLAGPPHLVDDAPIHTCWRHSDCTCTLNLASFPCSSHVRPSLCTVDASMWVSVAIWHKNQPALLNPITILLVKSSIRTFVDGGLAFSPINRIFWDKNKISSIIRLAEITTRILSILQVPSLTSYFTCVTELHISHHSHNSVTCVYSKICINFWPLSLDVAFSMSISVYIFN